MDRENDCDQTDEQTAEGTNFAICTNFDLTLLMLNL